jgi:hypothetical protein
VKGPVKIGADVDKIEDAGFWGHGKILSPLIATTISPVNSRRILAPGKYGLANRGSSPNKSFWAPPRPEVGSFPSFFL